VEHVAEKDDEQEQEEGYESVSEMKKETITTRRRLMHSINMKMGFDLPFDISTLHFRKFEINTTNGYV
jgi:hypothetical protein